MVLSGGMRPYSIKLSVSWWTAYEAAWVQIPQTSKTLKLNKYQSYTVKQKLVKCIIVIYSRAFFINCSADNRCAKLKGN